MYFSLCQILQSANVTEIPMHSRTLCRMEQVLFSFLAPPFHFRFSLACFTERRERFVVHDVHRPPASRVLCSTAGVVFLFPRV